MKESYINYWRNLLGDVETEDGRLYLYRKIKTNFKMEPYLGQIGKFKLRRSVTAFRISAHKLEIETGRYVRDLNAPGVRGHMPNIKREDRFCTLCYDENKIKVTGDEQHVMLHFVLIISMQGRSYLTRSNPYVKILNIWMIEIS